MNLSSKTSRMKAVRLHEHGALELEEIAVPSLGAGEALVRVHAAAITKDELDWPTDRLPAIPSYELSGVVAGVAADVGDFAAGDAVYATASPPNTPPSRRRSSRRSRTRWTTSRARRCRWPG
jgi:NADPH:quinone reductase-like Zn-dependent oxidoreductase